MTVVEQLALNIVGCSDTDTKSVSQTRGVGSHTAHSKSVENLLTIYV